MKNVLSADLFELRRSKIVLILPLLALALGIFMPMMYFGLSVLVKMINSIDALKDNPMLSSLGGMFSSLNAKTVFLSALPTSQGFGAALIAMIGYRAVKPFGTGIYRNKIVAKTPRPAIYLSQSLIGVVLSLFSAGIYTFAAALTSRLTFGELNMSGKEYAATVILTFGIYLVYTAIPVFIAFMTQSVPLTLVISILLPILSQTVISFIAPALISAPEGVLAALAVLPAFQNVFLSGAVSTTALLCVALIADVSWAALITFLGIRRFMRQDVK